MLSCFAGAWDTGDNAGDDVAEPAVSCNSINMNAKISNGLGAIMICDRIY